MSGPPKGCPTVTETFIATLPLNTGGPLEKTAPKPKRPGRKPTPTRRIAGDHVGPAWCTQYVLLEERGNITPVPGQPGDTSRLAEAGIYM